MSFPRNTLGKPYTEILDLVGQTDQERTLQLIFKSSLMFHANSLESLSMGKSVQDCLIVPNRELTYPSGALSGACTIKLIKAIIHGFS